VACESLSAYNDLIAVPLSSKYNIPLYNVVNIYKSVSISIQALMRRSAMAYPWLCGVKVDALDPFGTGKELSLKQNIQSQ